MKQELRLFTTRLLKSLHVMFVVSSRRSIAMIAAVMFAISALATDLEWKFTFNASEVTLSPKGDFTRISLSDGSDHCDAIGAPAIPAKYANILLPNGATDVKVSASGDLVLLASDVTPWPVQRPVPKSKPLPPFTAPDPVAYASAAPWPAVATTFEGLHHEHRPLVRTLQRGSQQSPLPTNRATSVYLVGNKLLSTKK